MNPVANRAVLTAVLLQSAEWCILGRDTRAHITVQHAHTKYLGDGNVGCILEFEGYEREGDGGRDAQTMRLPSTHFYLGEKTARVNVS